MIRPEHAHLYRRVRVSTTDAAMMLSLSVSQVQKLISDGRLEAIKPRTRWLVSVRSIIELEGRRLEHDALRR